MSFYPTLTRLGKPPIRHPPIQQPPFRALPRDSPTPCNLIVTVSELGLLADECTDSGAGRVSAGFAAPAPTG
jgi:hypothetical protein